MIFDGVVECSRCLAVFTWGFRSNVCPQPHPIDVGLCGGRLIPRPRYLFWRADDPTTWTAA